MSRCRELLQRRGVSRASEPLGARDAAPCERARRLSDRALGNPVHSLAQAFRAFGGGRKRRGRSTGRGRGAAEAGRRAGVAGAAGRRGDPCARRGALSPLPPAHGGSSDRVRRFEDPEKIASWGANGPRCDGGGAAGGFRMLSEALPRSLALKAHAQRAGPPSTRAAAALHRIRSGRLKGAGCRRGRPSSTLPVLDPPSSDPRCLCPRKVSCPPGSPFGGARPGRQAGRPGALPARGAPDLSAIFGRSGPARPWFRPIGPFLARLKSIYRPGRAGFGFARPFALPTLLDDIPAAAAAPRTIRNPV